MAQTPNPIEVYEASVQQMLPIVAGDKDGPTQFLYAM